MGVQETSKDAYHGEVVPKLGAKQREVLSVLEKFEDMTNKEISDYIGNPINTVTPRILELRKKGEVVLSQIRLDKTTGMKAMAWKLKVKEAGQATLL